MSCCMSFFFPHSLLDLCFFPSRTVSPFCRRGEVERRRAIVVHVCLLFQMATLQSVFELVVAYKRRKNKRLSGCSGLAVFGRPELVRAHRAPHLSIASSLFSDLLSRTGEFSLWVVFWGKKKENATCKCDSRQVYGNHRATTCWTTRRVLRSTCCVCVVAAGSNSMALDQEK